MPVISRFSKIWTFVKEKIYKQFEFLKKIKELDKYKQFLSNEKAQEHTQDIRQLINLFIFYYSFGTFLIHIADLGWMIEQKAWVTLATNWVVLISIQLLYLIKSERGDFKRTFV